MHSTKYYLYLCIVNLNSFTLKIKFHEKSYFSSSWQ